MDLGALSVVMEIAVIEDCDAPYKGKEEKNVLIVKEQDGSESMIPTALAKEK